MTYNRKNRVDSFEKFFVRNYPKVKGFAIKLLQNEEDAEDVAQEIFLKIWNQPDIWMTDQYNDSYIYTMTKNCVFNIFKKRLHQQKYQSYIIKEQEPTPSSVSFEDEYYAKELALLYRMKIDNMPAQRKQVFKLSRYEGASNQEIADKLHLSIRTVERHIYLALKELKEIALFFIFLLF